MNKKHLIYSFQYAAVLASVLTFSSCKKDEFTAEQALDIENKRKQFQFDLDEKSKDNEKTRANFMMWQARKIDSLQKVNAGGQVFYSVTVVPGGSSAFGQGRFEEVGLSGIDVTVEQYGFVYTEKTVKGIAYFKKPLFSGEANVTVDAQPQGYTSVSYIANLTPDGGVPNDGTVFVGNIIPVFDNDPTKSTAADNMSMISGKALADLDLTDVRSTDGTTVEENVPDGVSFSAVINVDSPEFRNRYLREWGDEDGIHIGGSGNTPGTGVATKSGFIQRIAYEKASTVARVANGEYSMMVAATASGLPMKMRYSDFAFDRRYVNNFGNTVEERYLYGPEVGYNVDFTTGTRAIRHDFDINLVQTDATIIASLTKGTSPYYFAEVGTTSTTNWLRPVDGIGANNTENRYKTGVSTTEDVTTNNNAGAYLKAPSVTFSAPTLSGGVQTVGAVAMYDSKPQGATATTAPVFGTSAFYNADASSASAARTGGLNLRGIKAIKLTTIGSGYATPPTVTLTPNLPGGEGTGSLQASSSGISYIRVINGGFGLVYSSALHNVLPESGAALSPSWSTTNLSDNTVTYQGVNQFTGVLPKVVINGGIVPSGGSLATAQVVANTTIGTLDEIRVTSTGNGYSPSTSAITFNIGSGAGIEYTSAAGAAGSGSPLRVTTAGAGLSVQFLVSDAALAPVNSPNVALGTLAAGTFNDTDVQFNGGSNYTFVPGVQVLNIQRNFDFTAGVPVTTPTAINISNLEVRATVEGGTGTVRGLSIIGTPSVVTAGLVAGDELRAQFNIVPRQDWPASAAAFLTGSGIDNYVVSTVGTGYGSADAVSGDGSGAFNAGASSLYDYYTFAATALGGPGSLFAAATPIASVTSYANNDGDYDVEFFGATGLAGNTVTNPTAIPVFQSGGSTLAGIRIFSPGVNIAAGSATVPAIKWRVIPRGYKAATITTQLAPAAITFTITDGGLGYAVRPDIILTTDKLTYIQTAALNNINNFRYTINSAGTITKIEFLPSDAATSNVLALLNDATVGGTLNAPIVTVASQELELYNNASFIGENAFLFSPGDGAYHFRVSGTSIGFGQHGGTDIFGLPGAGDDIPTLADDVAWDLYATNTNNSIMHWPQSTPAFGEAGEVVQAYYTGFTLDVTFGVFADATNTLRGIATGTGASAKATLNPADGTVATIDMVSGGSGYRTAITFNRNPITTNFTVFGGPDGYTVGGLAAPTSFQTYSGIQYVRDIHYGVGRRIH